MRPGTSGGPTPSKNLFGSTAPVGGARAQSAGNLTGGAGGGNINNPAAGGGGGGVRFVGVGGSDFGLGASSASLDFDPGDGSRTPLTAQIEVSTMHLKNCEQNVATLNERLGELQANVVRSKQLEAELGPRESETKNVVNSFQRLVETGTRVKKSAKKKSKDADDEENASHEGDTESQAEESRSEATGTNPTRPHTAGPHGGGSKRFGLNLLSGKDDMTREEMADRDAIRGLGNRIRHSLMPVLSEVFFLPPTQREVQKAQQRQADEAAAAAAANPKAAGTGGGGGRRAGGGRDARGGGGGSAAAAVGAPLLDRLDPELYLMPGIDPSFFTDVLNLRQMRLNAERALSKTQEQLQQAQSIVTQRRNDGSNKTSLRRAEKSLVQAQTTLRELHRQREEREIRRRLEQAAAADAKEAAQAAASSGMSGVRGGGLRKPPMKSAVGTPKR